MKPSFLFLYQLIAIFIPETRGFKVKNFLLKLAGVTIGKGTKICSSVKIIGNGKLIIGENCWIGPQSLISSTAPASIIISNNVDIAPKVTILTGSHKINLSGNRIAGEGITKNIHIKSGCWLCTCAVILSDVIIGEKSIITANSVVKKNIPSKVLFNSISNETITQIK